MVMRPPSDVLAATELAAWPQATSFALLDDPLAFIAAEHLRLRHVCAILRDFAEADCLNRSQAANVVEFLRSEFVLHHQDEEDSLFPVLARRLLPEDDLGAVLAHLRDDHRQLASITERIVAQLNALAVGGQIKLDDETRLLLIVCAESEQRHRAVEDGIVLAIARIRLAENDLDEISRSMKARRGVAN